MYLWDVDTRFNRSERNYDANNFQEGFLMFSYNGCLIGKADFQRLAEAEWHKAHLYVLKNCEEVQEYVTYVFSFG